MRARRARTDTRPSPRCLPHCQSLLLNLQAAEEVLHFYRRFWHLWIRKHFTVVSSHESDLFPFFMISEFDPWCAIDQHTTDPIWVYWQKPTDLVNTTWYKIKIFIRKKEVYDDFCKCPLWRTKRSKGLKVIQPLKNYQHYFKYVYRYTVSRIVCILGPKNNLIGLKYPMNCKKTQKLINICIYIFYPNKSLPYIGLIYVSSNQNFIRHNNIFVGMELCNKK